jgi:hypothetical protein
MTYFPQNQNGQANNSNSSPVTISSDQIGANQLASEEANILLRRIVKLLESNAVVDSANRQRVTIEGISGTANLGNLSNVTTISNMDHRQFIDISRNTYANCIRSKLNFS